MELESKLADLAKVVSSHREFLLTEEAAKTALVMPFLRALGYDVFNPAEVVPEFTCDVATKKGEKVDYAICDGGKITMLVECKPANTELSVKNAAQLFRYFSVTDARVAVLTNGVVYKFFTDLDAPNKMDDKPFFTCQLDALRKQDIRTLGRFAKVAFDIEKIVDEAVSLKLQTLLSKELQAEFADPSEEFVRIIAARVQPGARFTSAKREELKVLIANSISALIRDLVHERLTSALTASSPLEEDDDDGGSPAEPTITTEEEIAGFNIIRAIAAKVVDPKRIVMRDAQSYCAVLLDDNNRKTVARLHFNSPTTRYLGTFAAKDETRHPVADPVDIYKHDEAILMRIAELVG
ncbi:MAG: putative type restriction endonuclease [Sphingomonadales bacterium]|jgi:hypothetical protein|nr:putative type restriction endonuclease [Sphingomonadales bacterium]